MNGLSRDFNFSLQFDSPASFGYLSSLPQFIMVDEQEPAAKKHAVVSISSTFSPGPHATTSDTVFRSSDAVLFYVNSTILLRVAERAFKPILQSSLEDKKFRTDNNNTNIIDIPDTAAVLTIILHVFHDISLLNSPPSLDVLETAVDRMHLYGLVPPECIIPTAPLFDVLYSYAQSHAIRLYALAGNHNLHALAEKVSPHLLSYNIFDLSDDLAKRMGAKYLKRLMGLHVNRVDELKRIIIHPPHTHPPTPDCNLFDQKDLARAWALAASYLAWDCRPELNIIDLAVHSIRATFSTLNEHLFCNECRKVLQSRIREVIVHWLEVKDTI